MNRAEFMRRLTELLGDVSPMERDEAIHPHLRGFLDEPFHTVHVFGRGHSKQQPSFPVRRKAVALYNLHHGAFGMGVDEADSKQSSLTVDHLKEVAGLMAQHPHAMARLNFGHQRVILYFRAIKAYHQMSQLIVCR